MESSIKYIPSEGEGGSQAKSVPTHVGGGGEVHLEVYLHYKYFFVGSLQSKESKLFRQPKLSIRISSIQLKMRSQSQGSTWCIDSTFGFVQ